MKKQLFVLAVAATVLAGCSKEDGDKTVKVAKFEIEFNISSLSTSVTEAYNVIIAGTGFDGKRYQIPVTATGVYKLSVDNPDMADNATKITYGIFVEQKAKHSGEPLSMCYRIDCKAYSESGAKSGSCFIVEKDQTTSTAARLVDQITGKSFSFGGSNDNVKIGLDTFNPNETYYAGEFYKTMLLGSGVFARVWMVENLRYVPAGVTVSGIPGDGKGVWYPYTVSGSTATPDTAGVKERGYFYDIYTATQMKSEITVPSDTASALALTAKVEGVQGICPEGWHIPTLLEMVAICGENTTKNNLDTELQKDTLAPFWNGGFGSVSKADSLGFSMFHGSIANNQYQKLLIQTGKGSDKYEGKLSMNYLMGSTLNTFKETGPTGAKVKAPITSIADLKVVIMQTTITSTYAGGRLSAAQAVAEKAAAPLRCVRDK